MLGSLAHFRDEDRVAPERMPELERLMLHRLAELDLQVRRNYADFDYKRIFAALNVFMTAELSAFYFDVRKDVLYCDPISSTPRRACLTVLDHLFRATVCWLAPMLPFTAEEAWLTRYPSADGSVHLESFPEVPVSQALRSRLFFKLRRERVRAVNLMGEGEAADRMVAERVGITPDELRSMVHRLEARDVSLDVKVLDDSPVKLVDLLPAPDDQERSLFEQATRSRCHGCRSIARHEDFEPAAGTAKLTQFQLLARFGDQKCGETFVGGFLTGRIGIGFRNGQLSDPRPLR